MSDLLKIYLPLTENTVKSLRAGTQVLLNGTVFTARDAAHKRIVAALNSNKELPFKLKNATIYYTGPSPAPPGRAIGSAGPTTSYRMDPYTPQILNAGVKGLIGKGMRGNEVAEALIKNIAVYFAAIGGAGALLSECIKSCEIVAYDDLGTEAVHKLYLEDFPVVVAQDCFGGNVYLAAP